MQDNFLDFNTVGHETAAIQVENIKKSLEKDGFTLGKVLQLSRDNPNVMKSVFSKLKIEAAAAGNPNLLDAPCYIHPTHTAFRKAVCSLVTDMSDILNDLFGFFKHTMARRSDLRDVRQKLADRLGEEFDEPLSQSFLRHVESRWLEMQNCLVRLLSLWDSSSEYFLVYLPNSTSQLDKKTIETDRYKKLAKFFRGTSGVRNKIRVRFLIFLSKIFRPILIVLQAQNPWFISSISGLLF